MTEISETYFYTAASGRTPISVCCRGVAEQKEMVLASINALLCLSSPEGASREPFEKHG